MLVTDENNPGAGLPWWKPDRAARCLVAMLLRALPFSYEQQSEVVCLFLLVACARDDCFAHETVGVPCTTTMRPTRVI